MTVATPELRRPRRAPPSSFKLLRAAVRSEWTKLRTVRSTIWSLLVTVAIVVGLGALFCAARVSRWDRLDLGERRLFDPAGFSLNGIFLAQLAIGVLGVLVMSSEYATGQIRATLGAIPQRGLVLTAKALVFGVVTLVVGLVACLGAFGIGQAIFTAKHAGVSLGDPGVTRAVVGGALYLAAVGLLGLGLAAVLRRTAGAIATLVGLLLGILGILVMSSEYATGTIRATLAAQPRRPMVLAAKILVFAAVTLVVAEVTAFAGFLIGQAFLTSPAKHATLSSPGALRAVAGIGLVLCVCGLLGFGIAVIVRHTAGAIGGYVFVVLVLPLIVSGLPNSMQQQIERLLPASIGSVMIGNPVPDGFGPWTGFGILGGYTALILAVGAVLLVRRDA